MRWRRVSSSVANARMADAVRTLAVRRGFDPREFTLLAFGGAGPVHAAEVAAELGIREVVIPQSPGGFSAWGMLHAPVRHDAVAPFQADLETLWPADVAEAFRRLEATNHVMLEHDAVPEEQIRTIASADMRYRGQEFVVNVVGDPAAERGDWSAAFHAEYLRLYAHALPGMPIEFVSLRLSSYAPPAAVPAAVVAAPPARRRSRARGGFRGPAPTDGCAVACGARRAGSRRPGGRRGAGDEHARPPGWSIRAGTAGVLSLDPGSRAMVDPITLEIVRNQLLAAADDMRVGMVRSAFTPIIYEAGDCAVALLDEHADVLAQSSGLPMFLGNLEQAVKASVELRGGAGTLRDGDAVCLNDSYIQGTHLVDLTVFTPVFWEGRLVGYTVARADVTDVGGADPGGGFATTEIYQEGLRMGPVLVEAEGQPVADVLDIMRRNSRNGELLVGDVNAMVTACRIGEQRLRAVLDRVGVDSSARFETSCSSRASGSTGLRLPPSRTACTGHAAALTTTASSGTSPCGSRSP